MEVAKTAKGSQAANDFDFTPPPERLQVDKWLFRDTPAYKANKLPRSGRKVSAHNPICPYREVGTMK